MKQRHCPSVRVRGKSAPRCEHHTYGSSTFRLALNLQLSNLTALDCIYKEKDEVKIKLFRGN
jgi:hypothetical protein